MKIKLIVHHSAIPVVLFPQQFSTIDKLHRLRFDFISSLGFYVGYHFFIEKDGTMRQARKITELGAHTYNDKLHKSYNDIPGVCLAGNFMTDVPTLEQMQALKKLAEQLGVQRGEIYFHRELDATACPGTNMLKNKLEDFVFGTQNAPLIAAIRGFFVKKKVALAMQLLKRV